MILLIFTTLTLIQHIEALDKYDTSAPHVEADAQVPEDSTSTDPSLSEAEKRAAWRKARLQSIEEDALQAQIVIERMSELSTSETGDKVNKNNGASIPLNLTVLPLELKFIYYRLHRQRSLPTPSGHSRKYYRRHQGDT